MALKNFLMVCVFLMLLGMAGCPGSQMSSQKDQPIASSEIAPTSASSESGSGQSAAAPDAAATGGSSLTASAPYKQAGVTVAQNVNAAPFMIATQPAGKTATQSSELISRADGTMEGPNDQMAAGTGPEGKAMNASVPPKPAPAKPAATQPPKSKKK